MGEADLWRALLEIKERLGGIEQALDEKTRRDEEQNDRLKKLAEEVSTVNDTARRSIRVEPKWVALAIVLATVLLLALAGYSDLAKELIGVF